MRYLLVICIIVSAVLTVYLAFRGGKAVYAELPEAYINPPVGSGLWVFYSVIALLSAIALTFILGRNIEMIFA